MEIKKTEKLKSISRLIGCEEEEASKKIVEALTLYSNADILGKECANMKLSECDDLIDYDVISSIITDIGLDHTPKIADMLLSLEVFGDFDCPECGGRSDIIDFDSKMVGDGWTTPYEEIIISELHRCRSCKKTFNTY